MAEGTPDQDILIRYTVDAQAALVTQGQMEERIAKIKQQLISLAAEGKGSISTLARSMKEEFAKELTTGIPKRGTEAFQVLDPTGQQKALAQMKTASEEIIKYNANVGEAVRRIQADQRAENKKTADEQRANLSQTKAAQQEYIASWKSGIPVMSEGAKAFGEQVQSTKTQIQQLAAQTGQSFAQIGQQMVNSGANIKVVQQAIRELNAEAQATPGIFQRIGGAIQVALGIGIEQVVMKTVRAIINGFKEAIQAGEEYALALVKLEVGTRALQKAGMEISFADVTQEIRELRSQFRIFTTKEIVEGIGQISLLTQNLNLTKEQLRNTTEVTTALAVVMGKDFNEAARSLALFMSSGYGEALQKAGILASRMSVQQELLNMGIKGGYMQATDAQRALAAYNVIMKQSSTIVEEAKRVQGEYIFQIRESEAAWAEFKNTIGVRVIPTMAILAGYSTRIGQSLNDLLGILAIWLTEVEKNTVGVAVQFELLFALLTRKISFKQYIQGLVDLRIAMQDVNGVAMQLLRQNLPDIFTGMEDAAANATKKQQEAYQEMLDIADDFHQRIEDENKTFGDDMLRLETDRERDMEKIDRDGLERRFQLQSDYLRRLADIWRKLQDDLADEDIRYQQQITEIIIDASNARGDAERKYREREIKAQKDFEEKMRQLREDFLLEMEDALRERDARQVLRLIRQFNINQDRLKRERDTEHDERQREYKQELEDIERQKNEKLAALAREHAARIAELQRQAEIERRDAKIKYDQELADLQLSLANQKAERDIRYQEQLTDLQNQHAERLKEIAQALMTEYNLTSEMLNNIMAVYRIKYGPGGELEQVYKYMASIINAMNTALASIGTIYSSGPGGKKATTGSSGTGVYPKAYQTGGSFLATSPTIAKFGEVPEMVTSVPVNQLTKSPTINDYTGKSGRIAIDLFLSPDLEARIVDKSLDMNADIMLNLQRRR